MARHSTAKPPVARLTTCLVAGVALVLSNGCVPPEGRDGGAAETRGLGNTTEPANEVTAPDAEAGAAEANGDAAPAEETAATEEVAEEAAVAPEGKVLRHAVFFSFKPEVSEAEIAEVTEAFAALPQEIPEIIDFQWGVNNSPEGLDDGFTHCFLLTFKDEEGRAVYLPHEAHKAFGDVLRGKNDKVFVIDYWGDAEHAPLEKELKHAVFFRFKKEATEADIARVEAGFAELPEKIDTIKRFEWGRNNSPEHHDAGFTHCFMVSFDSEEGRDTYLEHPEHLAFVEILKPTLDAPRVLDFWVQQ